MTYCTWKDFTPVLTDFGVCYSLNVDHLNPFMVDGRGEHIISSEFVFHNLMNVGLGITSGMYMILNIEAFEKMSGPGETNGLKVYRNFGLTHFLLIIQHSQTTDCHT